MCKQDFCQTALLESFRLEPARFSAVSGYQHLQRLTKLEFDLSRGGVMTEEALIECSRAFANCMGRVLFTTHDA